MINNNPRGVEKAIPTYWMAVQTYMALNVVAIKPKAEAKQYTAISAV